MQVFYGQFVVVEVFEVGVGMCGYVCVVFWFLVSDFEIGLVGLVQGFLVGDVVQCVVGCVWVVGLGGGFF